MKQAALYARVSSKEQADEGFSIPAQLKLLREYAADRGFEIAQEFVDVETAKQAGRTAFGEMVEFLRRRHKTCRAILVEKTDRLYRSLRDYVTLDELDLEIHFAKEGFVLSDDSRSTEKFMHGIKVLMAKNYVDNLSEETSKGMLEKARQGTWPSYAPIGYVNEARGGQRGIAPDPARAPVVRRMFEWYAEGHCSLEEVRRRAIEAGFTGLRGGTLQKSTVAHILQNPIYTGLFVWDGKTYKGDHEPLISADLFQRAQAAFRKDSKPKLRQQHGFAYAGLITCARCGCAITAEIKKGKYVYYHCTSFRGGCDRRSIREEALEELLGEVVRAITIDVTTLDAIKSALQESHRDEKAYHDEQVASLQAEYRRTQSRMDRAYEDKIDGKISEEFWQRKCREWQRGLMEVRTAIERHETATRFCFAEGSRILDLAARAYGLWLEQDADGKRKLLNLVLSNCTFDGERLTASYAKPFCWLAEGPRCTNWLPKVDNWQNSAERFLFSLPERQPAALDPLPKMSGPAGISAIDLAFEFQRLLDEGVVNNAADIARRYGISRARVTQITNVLRLPVPVVDYLSSLLHEEKCRFPERQLRRILHLPTEQQQLVAFEELRATVDGWNKRAVLPTRPALQNAA